MTELLTKRYETQEDHSEGARKLKHLTEPPKKDGVQPKGVDFFSKNERALLQALQQGQTNIRGVRRADLKPVLPDMSASSITQFTTQGFGHNQPPAKHQ